jgi:NAD(P)-dependent dehydrogenase (short-subunit alcohol dehydrogenase family)
VLFSYEGKTALVVGAGSGIGRAISTTFASRGADLVLAGRTRSKLEAVAAEVAATGRTAHTVAVDLSDPDGPERLITEVTTLVPGLDVVVNSAGDWGPGGPDGRSSMAIDQDDFDNVFALHTRAPLFTSIRAAQAMMDAGKGGAILNVVSVGAVTPAPGMALYSSAKAALSHLTATLAVELGVHGIRINAVAPGAVDTPMIDQWTASEEAIAARAARYPLARLGTTDDVAAAAVYLCSDEASWVSGVTLLINGGLPGSSAISAWVEANRPPVRDSGR